MTNDAPEEEKLMCAIVGNVFHVVRAIRMNGCRYVCVHGEPPLI